MCLIEGVLKGGFLEVIDFEELNVSGENIFRQI
jgi:hypothetical protein